MAIIKIISGNAKYFDYDYFNAKIEYSNLLFYER